MSRSYREPWFIDSYGSKSKRWSKRMASKAVRRAEEVANGKAYRRFFDPWNIVDWKCQWERNDGFIFWNNGEPEWVPDRTPEWKAKRK